MKKKNKINYRENFGKLNLGKKDLSWLKKEIDSKKKYFQNENFKIRYNFKNIKKFNKFKTVVVLGMGGSILGAEAIYFFLKRKIKKKFIFLNNLDYVKIKKLKKNYDFKKTLFIIISKSGNTLETLVISNLIKNKNIDSKNTIIITENKKNLLNEYSKKNFITCIEHRPVGGRYSVFTEVGMVPAYLMGLKPRKFLDSQKNINSKVISSLVKSIFFLEQSYLNKKFNSIIFCCYSSQVEKFLYWTQQLIAESLGKKNMGLMPIISLMPKDHHSLLQLYLDGPRDKLFYFFSGKTGKNLPIKKNLFGAKLQKLFRKDISKVVDAQKNALQDIFKKKGIPYKDFEIKDLDEQALGELFSYFMVETSVLGKRLTINPFNQPAVEQVKIKTKEKLLD